MEKKLKVFLSGPISGHLDTYQKEFGRAAQTVTAAGHIALNPATMPLGLDERDYMRISAAMITIKSVPKQTPAGARVQAASWSAALPPGSASPP